ncbi:TAXI family TRAP transporter solute-binding subunit [Amphritea sp. 1_MG-2023]|uniref:TAXI family TRAP transporter solute-binding subunit n=1 Tax=Amphritea sp. 1_MG-2023 TaxID=3062670 RepID=UPI0026E1E7AD|nr:TAXI family TRAP transporter solute-binding subunit [Amphritea sp. 1_MG-2023]MDO6562721.1 TAXI family TRAP transporter solute-binding subunit [Amphritea sp. 1_MG-2023]
MAFRNTINALVIALGLGVASMGAMAAAPINEVITIGTGGVTGVYYPTGGAICRLVNKTRADHGIRCSTESTAGSVANLEMLADKELSFGITQSDRLAQAYNGTEQFAKSGANHDLKAVFAIYSEPLTVLSRAGSGIHKFDDLKGKKVNVGVPGSGQRGTMDLLMKAKGWSKQDFALAAELTASAQASALCAGDIDVMVYLIGHPSNAVKEATTSCDSVLVDVSGPVIDKLVMDNDYYHLAEIPGGLYRNNDRPIKSFAVESLLVASTDLSDEVVYQLVKSVFESFDIFRKLHPAFADLNKQEMVTAVGSTPLHPGAIRYYKEAGLL